MEEVLSIIFWALLSFMAADYTLGRATVRDPFRAVVASVFAVLFVLIVQKALE